MSNHQHPQPQDIYDVIDVDYEPATRQKGLRAMFRSSQAYHALNPLNKAARLQTEDYCRAILAKTALEHTAALSAIENQAIDMAPQNADLYSGIVRAYSLGAAEKIRRW